MLLTILFSYDTTLSTVQIIPSHADMNHWQHKHLHLGFRTWDAASTTTETNYK